MTANRLRSGLFVAAAGCMLAFGATGDAAPKVAAVHVPIVQGLHQTKALLNAANHDYEGFRAKAVHEVTKAIHALDPPNVRTAPKKAAQITPAPPAGQAAPAVKPAAVKEAQAASDKQLQQAIQQLKMLLGQLEALPASPRAAIAVGHVRGAIHELHTALKIN